MMILTASLLVLLSVVTLIRVISHDGYGSRPAPRSHRDEVAPSPYYGSRIVP